MLAVADASVEVEAQLLDGLLQCPSCVDGVLGPWGYGRERELRKERKVLDHVPEDKRPRIQRRMRAAWARHGS